MPKCSNHCNKKNCIFFRKAEIPAVVANDDITPPRNGDFCNMLVVYQATGNAYLFASDGIPTLLSSNDYRKLSNLPSINGVTIIGDLTLSDIGVTQLVEEEADARRDADNDLQEQIDTIAAGSDVVDIVGTYQELMQYDTSHLTINDVIKVLDDETENDATTYYRWTNDGWLFIGQEGPYYTKSQVNELLDGKLDDDALDDYYDKTETDALLADKADVSDLAAKQDKLIAGTNITIDQATNTISATVPSLDNYYTKQETYSQTEVDNLISGVEADIPTATSQLTNDSGFLTTLPIATSQILGGIKVGSGLSVASDGTLSADAQHIDVDTALSTTSTNPVENRVITNALNNKANLSDIPTVPTNVSAFYNDAGYVTSSTIAQNYYNKTETYTQTEVDNLISGVSADIPTKTSDLTNDGATGTSTYVELNQLATVATSGSYNDLTDKPTVMTGLVEMSYGEANAWAKFIAAYQAKQIVYCRASSAANPASGSQTRKAFMAYVNNADNPTEVEFQYVRSVSTKTSSQPVDQVFVYTLTSSNGGTWTVTTRDMGPKLAQGTNTTVSYSNGIYTISATQPTVPTKTSDLTNDGSDGTSTYIETDDAQKFAIGQGSTNPVFDEMAPVKTIEWDVTDQTYRPIYQMANTGWTYINMDITVAYRITVTGTNIHSVTDIVDRWHNPVNYPITSMFCRTLGSSGATTGLRYLRAVYPMSAYLNNASYPLGTEIAMYNATARHVKIEVFKDNSQVTWNTTKPSGPIYVSGTYNNNNVMSAYDTRGWRFRQPAQMYASNAGYAEYISNFEPVNTAASELKNGATVLAAGHYAFLADDGLVYDISNTAKNIAMCESKVGFMNSTVAANAAISYTYWRAISRPNATQVGYISHDTLALGNRVFLRCTMDSSGNVHSDNYLSTTMSAGYTWMPFGWARSATTLYADTRFPMFYTLDANGKLTHINGKEVAGSGAASVAWGDITGKPTFATVATSGSYNDLTNKPTVPEIKKRTGASTTTNITPLYVAGDGTTTTPMALKTHGDTRNGSFAYININEPTNSITEAYAGGYVWDEDEDWWRKMSEVRLALYSDIPTVPTVVQTTGQSTTNVMSQKAVTDIIGNVETILQTLNNGGGAQ